MKNPIKDSPWLGLWVRFHDRAGKIVIAPVEYVSSDDGNTAILYTLLDTITADEVLEKRSADDFDIEALKP